MCTTFNDICPMSVTVTVTPTSIAFPSFVISFVFWVYLQSSLEEYFFNPLRRVD